MERLTIHDSVLTHRWFRRLMLAMSHQPEYRAHYGSAIWWMLIRCSWLAFPVYRRVMGQSARLLCVTSGESILAATLILPTGELNSGTVVGPAAARRAALRMVLHRLSDILDDTPGPITARSTADLRSHRAGFAALGMELTGQAGYLSTLHLGPLTFTYATRRRYNRRLVRSVPIYLFVREPVASPTP